MELLEKYHEEGDCLSKALATMLLKSLNKNISEFKVSPHIAKSRDHKDSSLIDREFLKKTAVDSINQQRTDNSNLGKSGFSKHVYGNTPEVEVKPFNDGAYISQNE